MMRSSTQQMNNSSTATSTSTSSTAWLDEALALLDGFDTFVADTSDFAPLTALHFADDGAALRLVTKDIHVAVADTHVPTPSVHKQHEQEEPQEPEPVVSPPSSQLHTHKRKRAAPAAPARANPALKRPRKLPRLEILRLRDEVESLSNLLEELQQARTKLQQLREATALNTKLKQQVAEQTALHASLEALVHTMDATETLELFDEIAALEPAAMQMQEQQLQLTQTHGRRPSASVVGGVTPSTAAALAQLHSRIETLRRETRSVCDCISASSDVATAFSHSKTTGSTAATGQTFEVVTNTPADCGFEELAEQAWSILMRLSDTTQLFANTTTTKLSVSDTVHEKQTHMKIPCGSGASATTATALFADVHGLTVVEKFVESDCVVFVFASQLTVADTNGLALHECGCSKTSAHATAAADDNSDRHTAQICESVTTALSNRMRECVGQLQRTLLSELTRSVVL